MHEGGGRWVGSNKVVELKYIYIYIYTHTYIKARRGKSSLAEGTA